MSTTTTTPSVVTPSESASNTAGQPPQENAPAGKRSSKRSSKSQKGKDAPSGAVSVPQGGQNQTGKKSQVVSETIPISGWGETDLASFRKDMRPEFTTDANPYVDLVDMVYDNIQSRFSATGKHIPYALFVYYCMTMWWYRVLFLHKSNANTLTQEEKQAYNVLCSGEEFMIPAPIAQYLANLGNFSQGGETFYFRKLDTDFSGVWENGNVEKGWLKVGDDIRIVDGSSFWKYAQVPVPGLVSLLVQAEAEAANPNPQARPDLTHISPAFEGTAVTPTANLVGWKTSDRLPHHSSWRSTYASLNWRINRVPVDMQTNFNISNSTLKWVSEKLETVNGLKLHSSKQLSLSVQGNPIIAHYLGVQHECDAEWLFRDPAHVDNRRGALVYDLALASRFSMDDKSLAPSFSFGYRLKREKAFCKPGTRYGFSEFDPFLFWKGQTRQNLPQGWWAPAESTFTLGSQNFINIDRFSTHSLNRSNGMNAAIVLAPTTR